MTSTPLSFADKELFCFDNDGTLFRSEEVANPAIKRRYVSFVRSQGLDLPEPSDDRILELTGQPGPVFYRELLPAELAGKWSEFREMCIDEEVLEVLDRGRFFEGIEDLLTALKERQKKIALITNAGHRYIGAVAERLNYDYWLDGLYHFGKDGLQTKGEMIERAMSDLGTRSAVMIGDRKSDIEGAQAAGIPSVLCRYGFGHPEESAGSDVQVDSVNELTRCLLDSSSG